MTDSSAGSPPEPVRDLAWEADRAEAFGRRMLDLWTELLATLPERRIAPGAVGSAARAALALPVPDEPLPDDALFDHLRALTFDWAAYCGHPRFMAYITGAGTVPGAAADLLASGINMNLGGWRLSPGASEIERCLIRWFTGAFGLPAEAGVRPLIVVASAGTVATGAIDPLPEVAALCKAEGLWMHVDGAYGGPAVIADALRRLFAGIEHADSIAFDPHKWMYTPHSGGCVLVRDERLLQAAFDAEASYVHEDTERVEHDIDFARLGPQFSRGFQALKIWVSLLAHGRRAYSERIAHDAALARYLAARVSSHPSFQLSAPVTLSICCFRYVPADLPMDGGEAAASEAYLSQLNERIMTELQLDGRVFISNAVLGERFVLRACVVNFRTEAEDMDAVLDVAEEFGARLDAELRPAAIGLAR